MTSRNSANLHPIKFTRSRMNGEKDISQLFEDAKEDNTETGKERSTTYSSIFGHSELLIYKLFYLFFYAATSLFAYLPLYYKKSLLLDHHHVGILMGIRPFCGFIGAPILGSFADKYNKYKATLYTGLLTYIVVYLSITFVNGLPKDCDARYRANHTNTTRTSNGTMNQFIDKQQQGREIRVNNIENFAEHIANIVTQRSDSRSSNSDSMKAHNRGNSKRLDKPAYYSEDSKQLPKGKVIFKREYESVFDRIKEKPDSESMVLQKTEGNLTEEAGDYDRYWLYEPETAGEDTWPIDVYRKEPADNNPEEDKKIRDHIFMIILLLMLTAELIGSPILSLADTATLQTLKKEPYRYGRQQVWAAVGFGIMSIITGSVLHYTVSTEDEINNCPEKMGERYKPVFYSCCALLLITFFITFKFKFRIYEGKENARTSFFACITHFNNVDYTLFAFLAFFTGLGVGLTDSFLFVHLIRLGATPLILVITTTVQSVSKVIFFYFSPVLICKYGYFRVIYAGMLSSVVTFFYYSFLVSPWMVIPIELLSGLSYSCVWAALVSYVGAPPKIGATLQGILHSLHIGLGRGIGGLFGGMILLHYGFDILFRSFSLVILIVIAVVSLLRHRSKDEKEPIWSQLWDYSPVAAYATLNDQQ